MDAEHAPASPPMSRSWRMARARSSIATSSSAGSGGSPSTIARWWSCTTTSTCRSTRSPRRSASRSGRSDPDFIMRCAGCARHSTPTRGHRRGRLRNEHRSRHDAHRSVVAGGGRHGAPGPRPGRRARPTPRDPQRRATGGRRGGSRHEPRRSALRSLGGRRRASPSSASAYPGRNIGRPRPAIASPPHSGAVAAPTPVTDPRRNPDPGHSPGRDRFRRQFDSTITGDVRRHGRTIGDESSESEAEVTLRTAISHLRSASSDLSDTEPYTRTPRSRRSGPTVDDLVKASSTIGRLSGRRQ